MRQLTVLNGSYLHDGAVCSRQCSTRGQGRIHKCYGHNVTVSIGLVAFTARNIGISLMAAICISIMLAGQVGLMATN